MRQIFSGETEAEDFGVEFITGVQSRGGSDGCRQWHRLGYPAWVVATGRCGDGYRSPDLTILPEASHC